MYSVQYTLPFLLCCIGTVVGSSLTFSWQLDRAIVRYASMRTVQIKYILQNCCLEKFAILTIGTDRSVPYGSISYYIAEE